MLGAIDDKKKEKSFLVTGHGKKGNLLVTNILKLVSLLLAKWAEVFVFQIHFHPF